MTPLDQTVFEPPHANCFQACLASLLEVPLDTVPQFMADHGENWHVAAMDWARERGFDLLGFDLEDNTWRPPGLWIAGGMAARGFLHACIYRGDTLAHDPHPDKSGLLDIRDAIIVVPLNPAGIYQPAAVHPSPSRRGAGGEA